MQDLKFKEHIEHIKRRWREAFDQYRQLKSQAEQAVIRWEWTDGPRYSPLPYYFERYHGRGSRLDAPPSSPGIYLRYGFDSDDRTRVCRTYTLADQFSVESVKRKSTGSPEPEYSILEEYYQFSEGLVDVIEF